jgi:hypothetical protein
MAGRSASAAGRRIMGFGEDIWNIYLNEQNSGSYHSFVADIDEISREWPLYVSLSSGSSGRL